MPWQLPIDAGGALSATYQSNSTGLAPLRALRLGDGASTWAIRLSHSPSVVDMRSGTAKPVDNHLPLAVSSANGRLMAHAELAWFLGDGTTALQVRWGALAQTLKTELSGVSLQ